jgi:hypothetical protein
MSAVIWAWFNPAKYRKVMTSGRCRYDRAQRRHAASVVTGLCCRNLGVHWMW